MFIPEFSKTDKESIKFLSVLIEKFLNNQSIRMVWKPADNNNSYSKYVDNLYFELERIYIENKNLDKFILDCNRLIEEYHPVLNYGAISFYIDFLIYIKMPDLAIKEWLKFVNQDGEGTDGNINQIIKFEQISKRGLVDGNMIRIMASGLMQLTDFGRRNFEGISLLINKYVENNFKTSFFEIFYINYSFKFRNKKTYQFAYYLKFFESNKRL